MIVIKARSSGGVNVQDVTDSPAGPTPPTPLVPAVDRLMPRSVSYARALLYLQASIWGLVCVVAILLALSARSASLARSPLYELSHDPALAFGAAGVAAALAGAKAWLGHRIYRGSNRTRQTVIVVECLMACLGAVLCFLTANLDGGFIPLCVGF